MGHGLVHPYFLEGLEVDHWCVEEYWSEADYEPRTWMSLTSMNTLVAIKPRAVFAVIVDESRVS